LSRCGGRRHRQEKRSSGSEFRPRVHIVFTEDEEPFRGIIDLANGGLEYMIPEFRRLYNLNLMHRERQSWSVRAWRGSRDALLERAKDPPQHSKHSRPRHIPL
jgi:hypothetical protein